MMVKTKPSFNYERILWNKNIDYVIGVDEVGRGAFAGPIVAGAVVFSKNIDLKLLYGINDSKILSFKKREECSELIKRVSLYYSIEQVDISYINKFGIGKANDAVFRKVLKSIIKNIKNNNYSILIDGFHKKHLPGGIKKQQSIIKGDSKSLSIAAASILAKVYRDNLMKQIANNFPNFNFSTNKGYGTKEHREALKLYGPTEVHRSSFNLGKFL